MKHYITNQVLDDGLGSRVLKMITLIGYVDLLRSQNLDVEFVYTPLTHEGNLDFRKNQLWCYYHKPIADPKEEYLKICRNWESILDYKGKTIFDINSEDAYHLVHPHLPHERFFVYDPAYNRTREIRKEIKEKFNLIKSKPEGKKTIIVHIRRADVDHTHWERWISDEYYVNLFRILESKFSSDEFEIIIYTQKKGFNQNLFSKYKTVFDEDIADHVAWKNMIDADVLVMSKSAYSYSAGILCDGLVIYPSDGMFHPKLNDWKIIEEI